MSNVKTCPRTRLAFRGNLNNLSAGSESAAFQIKPGSTGTGADRDIGTRHRGLMKERSILLALLLFWMFHGAISGSDEALVDKGLELTISQADVSAKSPQFFVRFKNVGVEDIVLNLGIILGNGKQYPTQLQFILTNPNGSRRELFEMGPPAMMGSVDDYLVPVKVGFSYQMTMGLDQFWSPITKEFGIKLSNGRYQIQASYTSKGAKFSQSRLPASYLSHIWTGQVMSNVTEFTQE